MTAPYPYLALTDGSVSTIGFISGSAAITNFTLVRDKWAPKIASWRQSSIGNQPPYTDVTEQFKINIRGSNAAECWQNLRSLNSLVDQVDRWYYGANENAVMLKYVPQGSTFHSTANPLSALVIAGTSNFENIRLSERFNSAGMYYEISDVDVAITRRGIWTDSRATLINGATSNVGGTMQTHTSLGSRDVYSPYSLYINVESTPAIATLSTYSNNGYILLTGIMDNVSVTKAATAFSTVAGTRVDFADITANGGTAKRFIAANSGSIQPGNTSLFPASINNFIAKSKYVVAGFNARILNGGTSTWSVVFSFIDVGSETKYSSTVIIDGSDPSSASAHAYLWDILPLPPISLQSIFGLVNTTSMNVSIFVANGPATLDVSDIFMMGINNISDNVINLEKYPVSNARLNTVYIDQGMFRPETSLGTFAIRTALEPIVSTVSGSNNLWPGPSRPYNGNGFLVTNSASIYSVMIAGYGTAFSYNSTLAVAPAKMSSTFIISKGYLTPE